ncbi:MAG TPA: hypothetical protein VFW96_13815, partial [Thermomicrobiales bacterium]|nr:hypothetical protein [Thermomicrobiales bacterium]
MIEPAVSPPALATAAAPRVVEVDPQGDPRWAAFVAAHPAATVYHHPAWLRVLETAHGYRPRHLACEDAAGEVCGVLPLFYKRGLVTGRCLSSLPHTPIAGPLARDPAAAAALVRAAAARAARRPGLRLQLKLPAPALDGLVPGV